MCAYVSLTLQVLNGLLKPYCESGDVRLALVFLRPNGNAGSFRLAVTHRREARGNLRRQSVEIVLLGDNAEKEVLNTALQSVIL